MTGWSKLHFASERTFMYTKMFAVYNRAHKNCVLEQKHQQKWPFA